MKRNGQNFFALVLKCRKNREQDLSVTLLTREQGKVIAVAKGVCKLTSSKRAYLEPGNLVQVQLVETKNWPILTQAKLVADTGKAREDLVQVRRLFLYLEILDLLLTAEEIPVPLWQKIIYLREILLQNMSTRLVRQEFKAILATLGYADESQELTSVTNLVSEVTGNRLCTYEYLRVK
ncbi:MAG: DNA repair protein RecO [bacterium]|nr:DNA repair protein RecO [bacterium]